MASNLPPPPDRPDAPLHMSVLGQFSLRHAGRPVPTGSAAGVAVGAAGDAEPGTDLAVSPSGQRLLALLAMHQREVRRTVVAEALWGQSDERHASWSLRSTLHRLPQVDGVSPVRVVNESLVLAVAVSVDVLELTRRGVSFRSDGANSPASGTSDRDVLRLIAALERDVLPDWHEDWVLIERERHRQLRLHALEALSRQLTTNHRHGLAVHAGLAATHAEPLRESAHRVVIEAHLAEHNVADALRQYGTCRRQFLDELGLTPSRSLQDLVFGRGGAATDQGPDALSG